MVPAKQFGLVSREAFVFIAKCGELTCGLIAFAGQLRVLFRERGLLPENLILRSQV